MSYYLKYGSTYIVYEEKVLLVKIIACVLQIEICVYNNYVLSTCVDEK